MSVQLNHTIVHAKDSKVSANFLAEILGLEPPKPFYHFLVVQVANGVSLDFLETNEEIQVQHYAFLVTEKEFDQIFERIQKKGLKFWPTPSLTNEGKINHNDGGRGVYFKDPSGNLLEVITVPYGG